MLTGNVRGPNTSTPLTEDGTRFNRDAVPQTDRRQGDGTHTEQDRTIRRFPLRSDRVTLSSPPKRLRHPLDDNTMTRDES